MRPVEHSLRTVPDETASSPDLLIKQLEERPQLMDAFTQKFIEQYGDKIMTQIAQQMMGARNSTV